MGAECTDKLDRNELADSCLWNEWSDFEVAHDEEDVPIPDVDEELAIIPNPPAAAAAALAAAVAAVDATPLEEWGLMGY